MPDLVYWIVAGVVALALLLVVDRAEEGTAPAGDSRLPRQPPQHAATASFRRRSIITPTSITHFQPQWIGRLEKSIHMAHVASIKIDTNLMFSDVYIETTGGQNPIICHGHTKGDAIEMKQTIETYQSEYYKKVREALTRGPRPMAEGPASAIGPWP